MRSEVRVLDRPPVPGFWRKVKRPSGWLGRSSDVGLRRIRRHLDGALLNAWRIASYTGVCSRLSPNGNPRAGVPDCLLTPPGVQSLRQLYLSANDHWIIVGTFLLASTWPKK